MVHLQLIHPHTMILTSFSSPAIPEIEESLWNSSRWRWCSAADCRLCGNRSNPGSSQSSQSSRYSSSLYQLMGPLSELPVMSWLVASCPGHEAESLVETMKARKIFQKIHHQSTRPDKKNDNHWRVAPNHDRNWQIHRIEICDRVTWMSLNLPIKPYSTLTLCLSFWKSLWKYLQPIFWGPFRDVIDTAPQ